jgi:hypothetical protein
MLGGAIEWYALRGGDTLLRIMGGDHFDDGDNLRGFRKLTIDDLSRLKQDIDQLIIHRSSRNYGT